MKIVQFNVTVDPATNSIILPDSPDKFTSMYFDSAAMTVQAVYTGELGLGAISRTAMPAWHNDTLDWIEYNARRMNLTKKEFNLMFTPAEYQTIQSRIPSDTMISYLWDTLKVSDYVSLLDPITIDGMGYLVAVGVLTPERHDEIMWGLPEDGQDPAKG